MKTFTNNGQQGDVLISRVTLFPAKGNEVKTKNGKFVIAEGEVTGHLHGITVENGVTVIEYQDKIFMENDHPVTLTHDEHNAVEIPVGIWEFGRVLEYDHFAEEARAVAD